MSQPPPVARRPAQIRNPDQLQQSRRADAPAPRAGAALPGAVVRPLGGVLLQLQSERAH